MIHTDIATCIPKLAKHHRVIEQMFLEKTKDQGTILAVATNLQVDLAEFDAVSDWWDKMNPKKTGPKRKRKH